MLDTNVVSDLIRRPHGAITARIASVGQEHVCTSAIVASELRYGGQKSGSERLAKQIDAVLGALPVMPFEAPADRHYGEIRDHLTRTGQLIGPNDLLIAAHARALGLTVVTANTREFERVPGLSVEDWSSTG